MPLTLHLTLKSDHLQLYETSPKTLLPLSLVSKTLCKSAEPFIFRDVTVSLSKPLELRHCVADLTEGQIGLKVQKHTRFMSFRDPMLSADYYMDPENDPDTPDWERKPGYFLQRRPIIPYIPSTGPAEGAHPDISRVWAPLVNLISFPKHLIRVTLSCGNKVPPRLWKALQQYQPRCKLTINFWWLQSLTGPVIDPDELAMVSLPCVDTIRYDFESGNDELLILNQQAVQRTIGLATNLRHLHVNMVQTSIILGLQAWPDFLPPPDASWKKGELESLSISGFHRSSEDLLKPWTSATDFSNLKEFSCYSTVPFRFWIPRKCSAW
jgi:hypothetical protein